MEPLTYRDFRGTFSQALSSDMQAEARLMPKNPEISIRICRLPSWRQTKFRDWVSLGES